MGDDHTLDLATLPRADLARYTTDLPKLLWADVYELPDVSSARPSRGDGADFPVSYGLYADPIRASKADEREAARLATLWRQLPLQRVDHPRPFVPRYGLEFTSWHSECICSVSLTADGVYAYIFPCDTAGKPFFVAIDAQSASMRAVLSQIRALLFSAADQTPNQNDGANSGPPYAPLLR